MHLNACFRNKPIDKANLFNRYFYEQFSKPSNYNIGIDWHNDHIFELDFNSSRIQKLLFQMNPNKTCGPDGIPGQILKNVVIAWHIHFPSFSKYRTIQVVFLKIGR